MARTEELDHTLSARAVALLERAGRTPDPPNGWVPAPPPGWVRYAAPTKVPEARRAHPNEPGDHADPGERVGWREGVSWRERVGWGGLTRGEVGRHRLAAPRVITVPAGLGGSRVRARGAAVGALLAVVLAVGVIFALRVAAAQRAAEPVPVAPSRTGVVARSVSLAFGSGSESDGRGVGAGVDGSTGPVGTQGTEGTEGTEGGKPNAAVRLVVVHVVGEVGAPGVVRVPEGSRVVDVIRAAGGALPSADLERINLARSVSDGEQVHVPAPGEQILPGANGTGAVAGAPAASAGGGGAVVNLNSADLAQLDTLPGVGPVLAQRILDWRAQHGRFTSVDELGEVSGIGDKLLAQLTPRVSV